MRNTKYSFKCALYPILHGFHYVRINDRVHQRAALYYL